MLLPRDGQPEDTVYYNGAMLIGILSGVDNKALPVADLFAAAKERLGISAAAFSLAVDWLYLVDAISAGVDGEVELCS